MNQNEERSRCGAFQPLTDPAALPGNDGISICVLRASAGATLRHCPNSPPVCEGLEGRAACRYLDSLFHLLSRVSCKAVNYYGARVRIGECSFNLAGNACKFTRNGRVSIKAGAEKSTTGEWYTSSVSDTRASAFQPEELAKLFKPFTQLNSSPARTCGGTGLGLAISWRLSRLMGGAIMAESTFGQGSTFTLRLPAASEPQLCEDSAKLAPGEASAGHTGDTVPAQEWVSGASRCRRKCRH